MAKLKVVDGTAGEGTVQHITGVEIITYEKQPKKADGTPKGEPETRVIAKFPGARSRQVGMGLGLDAIADIEEIIETLPDVKAALLQKRSEVFGK